MPLLGDIATSRPAFPNQICMSKDKLLVHSSILGNFLYTKDRSLFSAWKLSIPRKTNFERGHLEMRDVLLTVSAVSTLETKSTFQDGDEHDDNAHSFPSEADSSPRVFEDSSQTTAETTERERLRRMRISKANRGNVPWNKGRKHSAETLQRIRERTKLAMQDPKVKMKLVNLGHAQSMETRQKIGVGVRMGWQRRRERLVVQETCYFEWQNLIAETSRRGYGGDEELQWDSYKILDKRMELEWLKSIEQRKSTPRPKGNKRAPKSPEQRRKISLAISAKWSDPEYRGRVCSALAKYHGTPVGSKRSPPRRRPIEDGQSVKNHVKRKVRHTYNDTGNAKKSQAPSRPKKRSAPLYKDPLADSKLEMIKNIRAQRMAMETKKIEAMERAKLLISEAEKAAKGLEAAAMTSPLAHASLMETRKLIAEASRSIEAVERGEIISDKDDSYCSELHGRVNHFEREGERGDGAPSSPSDRKDGNGSGVDLASDEEGSGFDFGKFSMQKLVSHEQPMETRCEMHVSWASMMNGIGSKKEVVGPVEANGVMSQMQGGEARQSSKTWVCGRLVEVRESD